MSIRLGIAVGCGELRAVVVRRGRVVWHARSAVARKDAFDASLTALIASAPLGRWQSPRVGVAIGPMHSQVKSIEGLPASKHLVVLNRVVRENPESFFLRLGARLTVTDVERRADGSVWAASFDGGLLDDLHAALKRGGLSRITVVPHVVAIATVVTDGVHGVCEDGVDVTITTIDGRLAAVCRTFHASQQREMAVPIALAGLTHEASDFASAYGVAICSSKTPFAWRPAPSPARSRAFARMRVAAAAVFFALAVFGALVAPGVRAARIAGRAARDLAGIRSAQIEAARIDGELRRVNAELERVEQFRASRGRMTTLLGALSQALPDSTALVSLHVDTLEGSFVALTPHAADILPELTSLDPIVSARIVGSVTRETQGSARVERATVRFLRTRPAKSVVPRSARSTAR